MNRVAIAILCCLPVAPLVAQVQLEETLVTATGRAIDGDATALSWRAIDGNAIEFAGAVHINEIMQQVPGAWISRGNGQEHLTALRSPVLTGAGSCGAFFMALDGISLRAPGFCNVNQLFDTNSEQAGRIEVIKGPATARYGSNALHGVINILTAAPSAQPEQHLALEAGPDDYYRALYSLSGTQSEHGYSLRINGTTDGGYKDNAGFDQQKATARHDYSGERFAVTSVLDFANLNQETAGFVQGFEAYEDPNLKRANPNPEAYRDARSVRAYSQISWDLGAGQRASITPYLRYNRMEFLMHFLPWQPREANGHSSAGLRLALDSDWQRWRASSGIDLDYTQGWLEEVQDQPFSPNQPQGVHYDYEVDTLQLAAYSQLAFAATDTLDFEAGLRLESNRYDYDNRTGDGPACGPQASACRFFRPADRSDNFSDVSINGGANWQYRQAQHVYLRAAVGFRAPQTAELYRLQAGQQVADLESEQMRSVEVGLRGTVAQWLRYDVSAWSMRKSEVIFQDADRQNISGANTRHEGVDLALDATLPADWYARLDLGWANHQYDSDINLLGSAGNIRGNDIDTSPPWMGSARLGRNLSSPVLGETQVELEAVYLDGYFLEPDNARRYAGHTLLNLRASAAISRRVTASLRLTNLLNEEYAERADFGFGQYRYFVGQPRGVYLRLDYRLNAG